MNTRLPLSSSVIGAGNPPSPSLPLSLSLLSPSLLSLSLLSPLSPSPSSFSPPSSLSSISPLLSLLFLSSLLPSSLLLPLSLSLLIMIQRYYTRKLYNVIRHDFRAHLQTISIFATVIQRHWRGYAARRRYASLQKRTHVATQVQAVVRGWLARRAYVRKVRKRKAANTRIKQVETDFTALRTQMSNLNKYVLALAALVKQAAHHQSTPP
jgi:IQ calmodulin-binding motif